MRLPQVPPGFPRRLVYLDVPTRLSPLNVKIVPSARLKTCVKVLANGTKLTDSTETKVYVESSISKAGGDSRLNDHRRESVKQSSRMSSHYQFIRQPDVLPNFRMVAAFPNPYVGEGALQDIWRWLPPFYEGLVMTYIGLYAEAYFPETGRPAIVSESSLRLNGVLRSGLDLPSLGSVGLNQAWPLAQGVNESMAKATCCANPECQKPFTTYQDRQRTSQFLSNGNVLESRYCRSCAACFHKTGRLRSRKGIPNGEFPVIVDANEINESWFREGNSCTCHNPACIVQIPPQAPLFGLKRGIRCRRCFQHARRYKTEWTPPNHFHQAVACDRCGTPSNQLHMWETGLLCDSCNIAHCCYGSSDHAEDPIAQTVPYCGNAGCKSRAAEASTMRCLVEDTQGQVWRCLPCDWSWSLFGLEIPVGQQKYLDETS